MRGYFEDLETYRGMGFDREENVLPLYLVDSDKSLFVWNKKTLEESRKKDVDQTNKQLLSCATATANRRWHSRGMRWVDVAI